MSTAFDRPIRRVVFATLGSLGDLIPYMTLARELQHRGYAVAIVTNSEHRRLVESAGLEWRLMRPETPADIPDLYEKVFDPKTGPEFALRRLLLPAIRDTYTDLSVAVRDADLMVSNIVVFAAPLVAAKSGVPWASSMLAPSGFLSAYDPPELSMLPTFATRLSRSSPVFGRAFRAFLSAMTWRWSEPVRALRREIGLPPGTNPMFNGPYSPLLVLAMFSQMLGASQPDWPPAARITGFPFNDGVEVDRPPAPGLDTFLAAGTPPLVFTLGSAIVKAARGFYVESFKAARTLGQRALLIVGSDPRNRDGFPDPLPEWAMAVDYVPHADVFPRAAAIVHPGGIGTLAQALRAGNPQLVVPFCFDQPDNAARAARLGVADVLLPERYTADTAVAALQRLLGDPLVHRRAAEIAAAIRTENGVAAACDAIEDAIEGVITETS